MLHALIQALKKGCMVDEVEIMLGWDYNYYSAKEREFYVTALRELVTLPSQRIIFRETCFQGLNATETAGILHALENSPHFRTGLQCIFPRAPQAVNICDFVCRTSMQGSLDLFHPTNIVRQLIQVVRSSALQHVRVSSNKLKDVVVDGEDDDELDPNLLADLTAAVRQNTTLRSLTIRVKAVEACTALTNAILAGLVTSTTSTSIASSPQEQQNINNTTLTHLVIYSPLADTSVLAQHLPNMQGLQVLRLMSWPVHPHESKQLLQALHQNHTLTECSLTSSWTLSSSSSTTSSSSSSSSSLAELMVTAPVPLDAQRLVRRNVLMQRIQRIKALERMEHLPLILSQLTCATQGELSITAVYEMLHKHYVQQKQQEEA